MEAKYGLPSVVRYCRRCVISNQRPNSCVEFQHTAKSVKQTIHFDEDGICDACRVAEEKKIIDWDDRERQLIELLDQHRSKDGRPDIVVPGSGGKDSFVAAHVLKHKYGMHPLLVTWAPSIFTEWGWRNLVRWQSIGAHQLHTPNREVNRLLVRLSLENLFHPFACFVYGQKGLAPKIAARHNIKLCAFGESEGEYGNKRSETMTPRRDDSYYTASKDMFLGGVHIEELRNRYKLSIADMEPYLPPHKSFLDATKVEVFYLGHFLRWHPQSAYYYAVEHGNFEPSPERTPGTYSKYNSIDDKIDDLHYYTTYIKFGIGRATYDAAQEIRSGDITREEGVALVHRFDGEWPARFEDELFAYLSVDGFPKMDRERFHELAEQFKSPHLWDGERLRHVVA